MSSNASVKAMFQNMAERQKMNGNGDGLKSTDGIDLPDIDEVVKKGGGGGSKKLSVERIYQKKTQHEHILLRPDTYIGSVEHVTTAMWVFDDLTEQMVMRDITFVPGLYKIFDEILVNAADNKQRDPQRMDTIKIDINPEENKIKIWNNGKGIPVVMHKTEKMYVPTMIFGHLLTSSNYDDSERKVTGGRNGYGAKLCNIFSKKFVVETQSGEYKSAFRQAWSENMTVAGEPKILANKGDDYTCITFQPDLAKFKMDKLDKDIVDLFTRRAYDIVASSKNVKVYLNGKRLTIKNFKDYVELYTKNKTDDANQPLKIVHEVASDRWEIAITISKMGFQQVSFVNSIATTKGGRHVDYITDQVVSKLIEVIKRKEKKAGISIKPFQVKQHLWVFVNCLVENPTFDSQTKENMTLQAKSFGSKCLISEKFLNGLNKCGLVESIQMWLKAKQQVQLNQKCSATKRSKLKDVPKLDDANDAGTKQSINCTLILTEGDSAKTLAVAGLGVIGRDKFGIFPLRGKVLNVREAGPKQIMENAEINNVIKIVGLQYKEKYETRESLEKLRYGKIMIMTDQDQDGSHIKGLLINFFHHNWPNLLRHNFIEEFITPIVKVSKGKNFEKSFYSLPEFEEWKAETDNWHTYKVKYYKGLGTSTAKEAKEYFSDMVRHRIPFKYSGTEDDAAIDLAFSKKKIEERKEWLTNWMEERKRRNLLGLPEIYLYGKNTKTITFNEFVNRELILFSNMDNERSIPSLVDGFKPGQRKVMFTCIKRNIIREIKVAQLAGSVGEHSAYHHGEMSLMSTIVGLAQNFVGSNNLNLLLPIGQFGTRLTGGKDSASPRYIFTQLSSLTRHVFSPNDDALLKHLRDDNLKIEPEWYIPIIPMILINGAEGIGTGWSTKIPNYDVREIVNNLTRMIDGEEPLPMLPAFKNFRGTIEEIEPQRYIVNGEVSILDDETIEITELPVRTWTQSYKESVLEPMVQGTDKTPAFIKDYKEYHTESTVRFVVKMTPENLHKAQQMGMHKVFKLQTSITANSMVLFDAAGCIHRYNNVQEIFKEFFDLRLTYYDKRKNYLEGMLGAESQKLNNQARFIMEKCDGVLVIENKPKKEMIQILIKRGYDPDPVKIWKDQQARLQNAELIDGGDDEQQQEDDTETASGADKDKASDYNYLLGMAMWCLTKERKEELLRQRDQKAEELKILKRKSPKQLWHADLEALMAELDKVEKQESEDALVGTNHPSTKSVKGSKSKKAMLETAPSAMGKRVEPVIDAALRAKFEAATAMAKKRKAKKEVGAEEEEVTLDGEEGEVKSLAERIGGADALKEAKPKKPREKKAAATSSPKKTKAPGGWIDGEASKSPKKGGRTSSGGSASKKGGKKKKNNPWSESEDDVASDGSSNSDGEGRAVPAIPRETGSRRAAAAKAKYTFSDDESEKFNSDEDFPAESRAAAASGSNGRPAVVDSDSQAAQSDNSNDSYSASAVSKKPAAAPTKAMSIDDDDDGDDDIMIASSPSPKKVSKPAAAAGGARKKVAPAKKFTGSDDDDFDCNDDKDDDDEFKPKKKTKPAAKPKTSSSSGEKKAAPAKRKLQPAKKKFVDSDLSSDEGISRAAPSKKKKAAKDSDDEMNLSPDLSDAQPRARTQRAKAPTKYNFDDSEGSDA